MSDNPFPIQIKKRTLFNIISAIASLLFTWLIIGIYFLINNPANYSLSKILFSNLTLIVIAVLGVVHFIVLTLHLFFLMSIRYRLDNKNFVIKGGIVSRFEKVIPYSKIQHVIIYERFWQRILKLSSVSIQTAREDGITSGSFLMGRTYGGREGIPAGPFIPDLSNIDAKKLKSSILSFAKKYKPIAGI